MESISFIFENIDNHWINFLEAICEVLFKTAERMRLKSIDTHFITWDVVCFTVWVTCLSNDDKPRTLIAKSFQNAFRDYRFYIVFKTFVVFHWIIITVHGFLKTVWLMIFRNGLTRDMVPATVKYRDDKNRNIRIVTISAFLYQK